MNILYIRKKKCLQNTIVLDLCSNQSASSTKSLSAKRIFFYYSSCSFHWRKKMWIERARWMASYSLIKESHKFNIWHNHSLISIWTNISVCIVLIGHYPHCKERNIDGSMGDDNLNCFSYSGQSPLYFSHCHSSYSIAFRFLLINFFCVGFVQPISCYKSLQVYRTRTHISHQYFKFRRASSTNNNGENNFFFLQNTRIPSRRRVYA